MKKMHITPKGILPCTAGKRPCRYKFHGTNIEALQEKMDKVFSFISHLPSQKRGKVLKRQLEFSKTQLAKREIRKEIHKILPSYINNIVLNEDKQILADITEVSPLSKMSVTELESIKTTRHGKDRREVFRREQIQKLRTGKEKVDLIILTQDGYKEQDNPARTVKQLVYLDNGERLVLSADGKTLITSSVFTTNADLDWAYSICDKKPNALQKEAGKKEHIIQAQWRRLTKQKYSAKINTKV